MPKGPQGQKRPADLIGCAIMVGRIATGEAEDEADADKTKVGRNGALARAANLSGQRRREIATLASSARWRKEAMQ